MPKFRRSVSRAPLARAATAAPRPDLPQLLLRRSASRAPSHTHRGALTLATTLGPLLFRHAAARQPAFFTSCLDAPPTTTTTIKSCARLPAVFESAAGLLFCRCFARPTDGCGHRRTRVRGAGFGLVAMELWIG